METISKIFCDLGIVGDMTNPTGPTGGMGRVARGGCWGSGSKHCRVAARNYLPANTIFFNYGFRISRSP